MMQRRRTYGSSSRIVERSSEYKWGEAMCGVMRCCMQEHTHEHGCGYCDAHVSHLLVACYSSALLSSVRIPTFEDSGKKRGIAFVEFASKDDVNKALELNGEDLMGRYLNIVLSTAKASTTPRAKVAFSQRELSAKPEGCNTVFVGNLSYEATEDDLREAFSACGAVSSVRIANDYETGRSKGFGHVEFESTESVDAAVAMAGSEVAGRQIRVDYAGASASREGGGGGGGRGT